MLALSLTGAGLAAEVATAPAASAGVSCAMHHPYPPHPWGVFMNRTEFVRGAGLEATVYGFCDPDTIYFEIRVFWANGSHSIFHYFGHEDTNGQMRLFYTIPNTAYTYHYYEVYFYDAYGHARDATFEVVP